MIMKFTSCHDTQKNTLGDGYWFLFFGDKLLTLPREGGSADVPLHNGPDQAREALRSLAGRIIYLGELDGTGCWAGSFASETDLPDGYALEGLRPLFGKLTPALMQAARFAIHLQHWDKNTRFCGVCGAPT